MNRRQRRAFIAKDRGSIKKSPISGLAHPTRDGYSCAPNGERLVVARPKSADVAVASAEVALRHQDVALFQAIPDDDYTLLGYLSADGTTILHPESGVAVGSIQRGDSLVTLMTPNKD